MRFIWFISTDDHQKKSNDLEVWWTRLNANHSGSTRIQLFMCAFLDFLRLFAFRVYLRSYQRNPRKNGENLKAIYLALVYGSRWFFYYE